MNSEDVKLLEESQDVIYDLSELCHKISVQHGFWQSDNFAEKIMLVVTELSEAVESHRCNGFTKHLAEELADTVIRILDLCFFYGIDLGGEIANKVIVNEGRPQKHGKNY